MFLAIDPDAKICKTSTRSHPPKREHHYWTLQEMSSVYTAENYELLYRLLQTGENNVVAAALFLVVNNIEQYQRVETIKREMFSQKSVSLVIRQ